MITHDELIDNRDSHRDILIDLWHMILSAEGDLDRFAYDVDLTSGDDLLNTLRDVQHELGALIPAIETDTTAVKDAIDETAERHGPSPDRWRTRRPAVSTWSARGIPGGTRRRSLRFAIPPAPRR